jgi:hypothetical protein
LLSRGSTHQAGGPALKAAPAGDFKRSGTRNPTEHLVFYPLKKINARGDWEMRPGFGVKRAW